MYTHTEHNTLLICLNTQRSLNNVHMILHTSFLCIECNCLYILYVVDLQVVNFFVYPDCTRKKASTGTQFLVCRHTLDNNPGDFCTVMTLWDVYSRINPPNRIVWESSVRSNPASFISVENFTVGFSFISSENSSTNQCVRRGQKQNPTPV